MDVDEMLIDRYYDLPNFTKFTRFFASLRLVSSHTGRN